MGRPPPPIGFQGFQYGPGATLRPRSKAQNSHGRGANEGLAVSRPSGGGSARAGPRGPAALGAGIVYQSGGGGATHPGSTPPGRGVHGTTFGGVQFWGLHFRKKRPQNGLNSAFGAGPTRAYPPGGGMEGATLKIPDWEVHATEVDGRQVLAIHVLAEAWGAPTRRGQIKTNTAKLAHPPVEPHNHKQLGDRDLKYST